MLSELATQLNTIAHGWSGLTLAYVSVTGPMLTAAAKGKARFNTLLSSAFLAVPATMLASIAAGAAQPMLRGLGVADGGMMQFAIGVGLYAAVGYAGGRVIAKSSRETQNHRRGTLIAGQAEYQPSRETSRGRSGERSRGASARVRRNTLTLAGLPIPIEDETKHFKLIGTTGTGKSTAIREVLGGALERGDRAIVADPDGGYLRRFYSERRGDVILNPFDARSAKWDLYGEITNDYDVAQLARSLIPDQEGSERSWRAYGRTFLEAVVRQTRDGGIRDVNELHDLLAVADTEELKTLLAGTPAQPFLDDHNIRMFDSIRSVTTSATDALQYVGRQNGTPLSVRNWVQSGTGVLFIPYQAGQIPALRSMISGWMRLAIFETMSQEEGDRPLWFVVDELDALGQIDGLKDALARLRKFGGRCLLGFQSIAQVSGTYGRSEAQTIVENCGNTLILRCSASERGGTSGFASQLIGQREVIRTTESRSRQPFRVLSTITRSEHFNIEPAVLDSEIEQLPDLKGFLKLASRPEWRRIALAPQAAARGMDVMPPVRGGGASRIPESLRSSAEHGRDGALDGFDR